MKKSYHELTSGQKTSLTRSIRTQTNNFIKHHHYDLSNYSSKQDILNDLYFYWLRTCADSRYVWSKRLNALLLTDSEIKLIKKNLENNLIYHIENNPNMRFDKRVFKKKKR